MVDRRVTVAAAALIVLIVVGIVAASGYLSMSGDRPSSSAVTSTSTGAASSTGAIPLSGSSGSSSTAVQSDSQVLSGIWLSDNPAFDGNASKIDYPPAYGTLVNFTLGVINADRASADLKPVTLSNVASGQQHADSMAYYGYFSHWDTQGYKPYMRYTLLGGTGSVTENLAVNYCSTSLPNATDAHTAPCSVQTIENGINASEWEMMNDDMACCNNTHRDTILGVIHNQVSIGVAYNSTSVFLVEDFQDNYVSLEQFQTSGANVTLSGTLTAELPDWLTRQGGSEISIYYDPYPAAINVSELLPSASCSAFSEIAEPAACQYLGSYTAGTSVYTVFAPCPAGDGCQAGANYTYAQNWDVNSSTFSIGFSIQSLEASHGDGVYTVYLWPSERAPEPITSLSIFVTK